MMVSYDFYANTYVGEAIEASRFPRLARRAEEELAWLRRNFRVRPCGEDSEKMAICAMAEVLARYPASRGIQAQTVGGVTVRYESQKLCRQKRKELYDKAAIYLDIYRGVG